MKTVVGMYDRFEDAQQAVQDLVDYGFPRQDISLLANDASGEYSRGIRTGSGEEESKVAEGAGVGAVLGGMGGLLVGLGALAIPGIGPVIAAGPLVAALGGAGIGAAAGGLIGGLTKAGVPIDQAQAFAEGIRRGGTLVTITTQDDDADRAKEIMSRYNPVDIIERAEQWRQEKWTGFDETAQPLPPEQLYTTHSGSEYDRTTHDRTGEASIPLVEEDQNIVKENTGQGARMPAADFETLEPDFRQHFDTHYRSQNMGYNQIREAYRFGVEEARHDQLMDMDWDAAEPVIRQNWENNHTGMNWSQVREAVHAGWVAVHEPR